MSRRLMITAAALALLAAPAVAQTTPPRAGVATPEQSAAPSSPAVLPPAASPSASPALSDADRSFVREAATGGKAEVAFGKLAAQKGHDPAVKRFGETMVQDHTKADAQLQAVAGKDRIELPASSDQKLQADQAQLEHRSGRAFDRAYMHMMVQDHRKDVQLFQKETDSENADLKRYAANTLPVLQNHLNMAEAIDAKLHGKAQQGARNGPAAAANRSEHPGDHSANALNRQELRQLQGG